MTATVTPTQPFLATILDQHYRDMFPACGTCEGTRKIHRPYPGGWDKCEDCDKPRPIVLDDGPRLVYADYLEEQGDPRGEFIRVQCELAKLDESSSMTSPRGKLFKESIEVHALRAREAELLERHGAEWASESLGTLFTTTVWGEDACGVVGRLRNGDATIFEFTWHRGFPARLSLTARQAWGEACGSCRSTEYWHDGRAFGIGGCPTCHGSGRVGAILPAILKACPVESVRISDKEPGTLGQWWNAGEEGTHRIPRVVFDLLKGFENQWDDEEDHTAGKHYPTPDLAHAALSRAVIRHGLTLTTGAL